jgi:crotonobetainyl-CoA:carnitine CoA-transferase CaiB-like acyl-CoA transferase
MVLQAAVGCGVQQRLGEANRDRRAAGQGKEDGVKSGGRPPMANLVPTSLALWAGIWNALFASRMLGPGAISTPLADLGADVIKVEPPSGDYIRSMSWPVIEGQSLLHLHISRGKRSVVLDLRTDAGRETFLDLVRMADVVVEAMRPGGLDRRGLGYQRLREANPRVVMCTISGYGMTGPYRDLPSHGIAYDAWAGTVAPVPGPEGLPAIPDHTSIGITAGPLFAAAATLAAVLHARETGEGCHLEVAQSDAAAAFDWLRSEGHRAYQRAEPEVTGNPSDDYQRRPPGTAGWPTASATSSTRQATDTCCSWPRNENSGRTSAPRSAVRISTRRTQGRAWLTTREGPVARKARAARVTSASRPWYVRRRCPSTTASAAGMRWAVIVSRRLVVPQVRSPRGSSGCVGSDAGRSLAAIMPPLPPSRFHWHRLAPLA